MKIAVTPKLRNDIARVFDEARQIKHAADRALPSDAATIFLRALPNLLVEIDRIARQDEDVLKGRRAAVIKKKQRELSKQRKTLHDMRDLLKRLQKGPNQLEDTGTALVIEHGLDRILLYLNAEELFLRLTKAGRGSPRSVWSHTCMYVVANFWIAQGWRPTTSKLGTFVSVLRLLHQRRDALEGRRPREYDTFDSLSTARKKRQHGSRLAALLAEMTSKGPTKD